MTSTGRAANDLNDWMRDVERRIRQQERRATPTTAADLLGPGIAPTAVQLSDWNDENLAFTGFYFSAVGALHSPDPTLPWMGISVVDPNGTGYQQVTNYDDGAFGVNLYPAWPGVTYTRAFNTAGGSSRVYSGWSPMTTSWSRAMGGDVVVASTTTTNLGALVATVPTYSTNEVYQVTACVDVDHTGTATKTLIIELWVGGVVQGAQAPYNAGGVDGFRTQVTKTWLVSPMAAGSTLFRMTGRLASGSDTYTARTTHSTMSIVRIT